MFEGESLSSWRHEIDSMRLAHDLWREASREDACTEVLRQCLKTSIGAIEIAQGHIERMRQTQLQDVAMGAVSKLIDERLSHPVNGKAMVRLKTRLCEEEPGRLRHELEAATLLGSLWLNMLQDATGGARFRACERCGALFEVGPRGAYSITESDGKRTRAFAYPERRTDRARFCADTSCRTRAYLARKRGKRKSQATARAPTHIDESPNGTDQ